jgi:hypothetical protein
MRLQKRNAYARSGLAFTLLAFALTLQYNYILFKGEFYPSISLPRGIAMVRDDEPLSKTRWLLIAVTRDGARIDVDKHSLLADLPSQYRSPVIGRGFGLTANERATAAELDETREWLRARVERQVGRSDLAALEIAWAPYATLDGAGVAPVATEHLRIDF